MSNAELSVTVSRSSFTAVTMSANFLSNGLGSTQNGDLRKEWVPKYLKSYREILMEMRMQATAHV